MESAGRGGFYDKPDLQNQLNSLNDYLNPGKEKGPGQRRLAQQKITQAVDALKSAVPTLDPIQRARVYKAARQLEATERPWWGLLLDWGWKKEGPPLYSQARSLANELLSKSWTPESGKTGPSLIDRIITIKKSGSAADQGDIQCLRTFTSALAEQHPIPQDHPWTSFLFALEERNLCEVALRWGIDGGDPENNDYCLNSFINRDFMSTVAHHDADCKILEELLPNLTPPQLIQVVSIIVSKGLAATLAKYGKLDLLKKLTTTVLSSRSQEPSKWINGLARIDQRTKFFRVLEKTSPDYSPHAAAFLATTLLIPSDLSRIDTDMQSAADNDCTDALIIIAKTLPVPCTTSRVMNETLSNAAKAGNWSAVLKLTKPDLLPITPQVLFEAANNADSTVVMELIRRSTKEVLLGAYQGSDGRSYGILHTLAKPAVGLTPPRSEEQQNAIHNAILGKIGPAPEAALPLLIAATDDRWAFELEAVKNGIKPLTADLYLQALDSAAPAILLEFTVLVSKELLLTARTREPNTAPTTPFEQIMTGDYDNDSRRQFSPEQRSALISTALQIVGGIQSQPVRDFWNSAKMPARHIIEELTKAGVEHIDSFRDDKGCTLLMRAASRNDLAMIETLLEADADPETRDKQGRTPLMHAAGAGAVDVVDALLEAADPTATDATGKTALHLARDNKQYATMKLLLPYATREEQLSTPDENGNCPAHRAALIGHSAFFDTLPTVGDLWTELHRKNAKGETTWELLLRSPEHLTPIASLAKTKFRPAQLRMLCQIADARGNNLLHFYAANCGDYNDALVPLITDSTAHKELLDALALQRNKAGRTPFAEALANKQFPAVEMLLRESMIFDGLTEWLEDNIQHFPNGNPTPEGRLLLGSYLGNLVNQYPHKLIEIFQVPQLMGDTALSKTLLDSIPSSAIDALLQNQKALQGSLERQPALTRILLLKKDAQGATALARAAAAGRAQQPLTVLASTNEKLLTELLLAPDAFGQTLLHQEALANRPALFKTLREDAPDLLHTVLRTQNKAGQTVHQVANPQAELEILTGEVTYLMQEQSQLGTLLGNSPSAPVLNPDLAVLRRQRPALINNIEVSRRALRQQHSELRLQNRPVPFLLATTEEIERASMTPKHLTEGLAQKTIPAADSNLNILKLNTYLDTIGNQLPATINDDGVLRDKSEVIKRFKEKITGFAQATTAVTDHYNNALSPLFKKQICNVLRHLVATFEAREKNIASEANPTEQSRLREAFNDELKNVLVDHLGVAFFHCLDRSATECEDLYYSVVAPASAEAKLAAVQLRNLVLNKLLDRRRGLLDMAVARSPADKHPAVTHRLYRTKFAKEFGLGSNEMSAENSHYAGFAVKNQEDRIRAEFNAEYTPTKNAEYLAEVITDPKDKDLRSNLVAQWFKDNFDPLDQTQLLLQDGKWNPKAIAVMLHHLNIENL